MSSPSRGRRQRSGSRGRRGRRRARATLPYVNEIGPLTLIPDRMRLTNTLHAGWLTKRGHIRKNWLRRWVILVLHESAFYIAYYDLAALPLPKDAVPQAVLAMDEVSITTGPVADAQTGREHSLILRISDSTVTYEFFATTQAEIDEWRVKIISAQAEWYQHRGMMAPEPPRFFPEIDSSPGSSSSASTSDVLVQTSSAGLSSSSSTSSTSSIPSEPASILAPEAVVSTATPAQSTSPSASPHPQTSSSILHPSPSSALATTTAATTTSPKATRAGEILFVMNSRDPTIFEEDS